MRSMRVRGGWKATVALLGLAACGAGDLPGQRFSVTVAGVEDTCNDPMQQYAETFEYRVVTEGAQVSIFIGDALLAAGSLVGCDLTYSSPQFTDERGDGIYVRWSLVGQAVADIAGGGCDAGDGWVGEESIQVIESTDPEVPRGCSYQSETSGRPISGE